VTKQTPAGLLITRSLAVEALEPVGDGWTLHGLAVPYDRDNIVSDDGGKTEYVERFAAGAFLKDAMRGGRWVNLMEGHYGDDGERFLGRCVGMKDTVDGLYVDFRLNRDHPRAEEARSGELRGWSVGAKVFRTREDTLGSRVRKVRLRAGLNHVAATPMPQYAGAGVLAVRSRFPQYSRTPELDAARADISKIRADVAKSMARIADARR